MDAEAQRDFDTSRKEKLVQDWIPRTETGKKVKNGEPEMFDEVKWFTLDSLPENVHSQFPNFLDLYKERLVGK